MIYDLNNLIFEPQRLHHHRCEIPGIYPVRQLVDTAGSLCQPTDGVRILSAQPGYSLCRNNRLPNIPTNMRPGFPDSLLDGVILQLGQFRINYFSLPIHPFLCRTIARFVLYLPHIFLLSGGILEVATNRSGFFCGEQSEVASVYWSIASFFKQTTSR